MDLSSFQHTITIKFSHNIRFAYIFYNSCVQQKKWLS